MPACAIEEPPVPMPASNDAMVKLCSISLSFRRLGARSYSAGASSSSGGRHASTTTTMTDAIDDYVNDDEDSRDSDNDQKTTKAGFCQQKRGTETQTLT